jgi:putative Mg2+ transporter-C (MgtC) family protein
VWGSSARASSCATASASAASTPPRRSGYVTQAIIGALLVITAHLALRPLARRIDQLPADGGSEVQTIYRFRAVCRSKVEAHVRAQIVQAFAGEQFILRAVRSEDLDPGNDLVQVEAELQRFGRDDVALEAAVSRLSLEPAVSSVSWTVVEDPGAVLAAGP